MNSIIGGNGRTPRSARSHNRSLGWRWTFDRLKDGRMTVGDALRLIEEMRAPPLPGWVDGMYAAIEAYLEDLRSSNGDMEFGDEDPTVGDT